MVRGNPNGLRIFGVLALVAAFSCVDISSDARAADVGATSLIPENANSCIAREDADHFITDFHIDVASFGGIELCDARSDFKKLASDIVIIRDGRVFQAKGGSLEGGFVEASVYYHWMQLQTRGIERGQDIPTATAYNSHGYFTMQDGWAAAPSLARVGTVLHEARHTAKFPHRPCTHGPYAALAYAGCDASFAEGGAHAVEMEYYARVVAAPSGFHPLFKRMARMMALARSNIMFNDSPIRLREGLLVRRAEGMTLFDGSNQIERPLAPSTGRLKRSSFGATLWSPEEQKVWALDLYESGLADTAARIGDAFSYFKLTNMPWLRPGADYFDLEEYDVGSGRSFLAVLADGSWSHYDFAHGVWHEWLQTGVRPLRWMRAGPDGSPGVGLLSDQGFLKLDSASGRLAQPIPWPQDTTQFETVGGVRYRLQRSGELQSSASAQEWKTIPLRSPGIEMVAAPLYDAFEVRL